MSSRSAAVIPHLPISFLAESLIVVLAYATTSLVGFIAELLSVERKGGVSNAKEGVAAKKAEAISMQSSGCAADYSRFRD